MKIHGPFPGSIGIYSVIGKTIRTIFGNLFFPPLVFPLKYIYIRLTDRGGEIFNIFTNRPVPIVFIFTVDSSAFPGRGVRVRLTVYVWFLSTSSRVDGKSKGNGFFPRFSRFRSTILIGCDLYVPCCIIRFIILFGGIT